MSQWSDLKRQMWDESPSGNPKCWVCEANQADDAGHGIINKGLLNDKSKHKLLNHEINMVPQCIPCNRYGNADTFHHRQRMYNKKCDIYGQDRVDEWLEGLDLKVKERFTREEW